MEEPGPREELSDVVDPEAVHRSLLHEHRAVADLLEEGVPEPGLDRFLDVVEIDPACAIGSLAPDVRAGVDTP
jgi:hypothetical protein